MMKGRSHVLLRMMKSRSQVLLGNTVLNKNKILADWKRLLSSMIAVAITL
jgi:hypothetical protein